MRVRLYPLAFCLLRPLHVFLLCFASVGLLYCFDMLRQCWNIVMWLWLCGAVDVVVVLLLWLLLLRLLTVAAAFDNAVAFVSSLLLLRLT